MSHFSCFNHLKEFLLWLVPCTEAETHGQDLHHLKFIVSIYLKQWHKFSKFHYFVCNFIEHIVAFYRKGKNSRRPRQKQNLKNSVFQESDDVLNRSVYARSEVLTALLLKIQFLWHVTLCCWVCCFKHLKGASPSLSCSPRNLFLDCMTTGSIVQCSV